MIHRRPFVRWLQTWTPAAFWLLLFVYAVWPWMPWNGHRAPNVIFYGFSILGEPLNRLVLPAFQQEWRQESGENVEFVTSFAGSGTVTNQLVMGVPAQLALLALELDALRLAEKGVIGKASWKSLPHEGVVNRTPIVILVRPGNPKRIFDFSDLARPGIGVVHPDPATSGGAGWAVLAEYGAGMRLNPERPHQGGYELLMGIWRNVVAQAQSARAARTQFENGFGDALVTYEQEALWDRARGNLKAEIVYPSSTILCEHVLVIIERNIDSDQRAVVNELVDFLWSERGQQLFVDAGFRSVDARQNSRLPDFGVIEHPFLVAELGGWERAKREILEGVWQNRVMKRRGQEP